MNLNIPKTKNIYHAIKRNSYVAKQMNEYLTTNSNVDRRVGALPIEWLENVDKRNIPQITKDISDLFVDFSDKTKNIGSWIRRNDVSPKTEMLEADLKTTLQKILKRPDVEVSYAGGGALKKCHKLTIGDKSYALSIFRAKDSIRMGFDDYYTIGHGRGCEPQNVFTGYKRGSHGRWAKPFMSTLFSEKDTNGYILSKFIDKSRKPKSYKTNILASREYFVNSDYNEIAGVCIEAGGNKLNKKYIPDRHVRENWARFANIVDANAVLLSTPQGQYAQARLMLARELGVNIFSKEFVRGLDCVPNETRRPMVKIIRSMQKLKNLRTELELKNEYDTYKKLLKEDFVDNFKFSLYSDDILYHRNGYPRLMAETLGVDNVPPFIDLVGLASTLQGKANIRFNKYYPREEAIKYLNNNYDFMRANPVINKIKREYKLEKEIADLEHNYQKKISENPAYDLSDLIY